MVTACFVFVFPQKILTVKSMRRKSANRNYQPSTSHSFFLASEVNESFENIKGKYWFDVTVRSEGWRYSLGPRLEHQFPRGGSLAPAAELSSSHTAQQHFFRHKSIHNSTMGYALIKKMQKHAWWNRCRLNLFRKRQWPIKKKKKMNRLWGVWHCSSHMKHKCRTEFTSFKNPFYNF